MRIPNRRFTGFTLGILSLAALSLSGISTQAATITWTGGDGDYQTGSNWSSNSVPNTAGGDTAIINNGAAVTYNPGGDYTLANGGTLQITNGSWTQINSGAWIQMQGNASIIVNGGTFNQGTDSNAPFNVSGTNNNFTISSGAANLTNPLNVKAGLNWTQTGGTVSGTSTGAAQVSGGNYTQSSGVTTFGGGFQITSGSFALSGGTLNVNGAFSVGNGSSFLLSGGTLNVLGNNEFDFSSLTNTVMTGGTLNVTKLLTGVNGPVGSTFNFAGGVINDDATTFDGFYGADNPNHPFNFTLGSTGVLNLSTVGNTLTVSEVQGWITAGGIQYNNTIDTGLTLLSVTQTGNTISVAAAIPEPSTYAMLGLGGFGLLYLGRRRKA